MTDAIRSKITLHHEAVVTDSILVDTDLRTLGQVFINRCTFIRCDLSAISPETRIVDSRFEDCTFPRSVIH